MILDSIKKRLDTKAYGIHFHWWLLTKYKVQVLIFFSQLAERVEHASGRDRYYASFVRDSCHARSHVQYSFTAQLEKLGVGIIRLLASLLRKGSYQ